MVRDLNEYEVSCILGGATCTCRQAGGKAVKRMSTIGDSVIWCRSYCCSGNFFGVIYFTVNEKSYEKNYDC